MFGTHIGVIATSGTPPALNYEDGAGDAGDRSTYTFSARNVGTASADRIVAVCVSTYRDGSTTARTVSGLTIDGNAAASAGANTESWTDGVDYGVENSIWTYNLAAGTTADIVVSLSGTADGCSIRVYTIKDYTSAAAHATHSADNTTSTSFAPGSHSVIISVAQCASNAAALNGDMTQDTDGWFLGASSLYGASGYNADWPGSDATISCTNTLRGVFAASWI